LERLSKKLFETLAATDGLQIPISPDEGERNVLRHAEGLGLAPFPADLLKSLAR
jgi:N-acetylglucosamine-6-sulfatase